MNAIIEALRAANIGLAEQVTHDLRANALHDARDDDLCTVLAEAAELVRRAEAVLVEATGQVRHRSDSPIKSDRMTIKAGCTSVRELVQRCTRASARQIRSYERLAASLHRDLSFSTGELLPGRFPQLRDALMDGEIGADALTLTLGPVAEAEPRIGSDARLYVDAALAAHARGTTIDTTALRHDEGDGDLADDGAANDSGDLGDTPDELAGELPESADALRARAQLLITVLDHDGAEPREFAAMRKRGLSIGPEREGVVSVRGYLLPEVGAQLRLILDSLTNPKVRTPEFRPTVFGATYDPTPAQSQSQSQWHAQSHARSPGLSPELSPEPSPELSPEQSPEQPPESFVACDDRTRPQQIHDAFATALTVLARTGQLPQIGGATPTLVVSVRAEDLADGRGWAHAQGSDEPVSLSVARHVACTGQVQRVVQGENGRILRLGVVDRVFNAHQRRAIVLRDGGCIIPGCTIPASWCEIHHVHEHAAGGATHTDNGVSVCWHHHRTLDAEGWEIRMRNGAPEVRAPSRWDPGRPWRPATKTRVRHPFDPPKRHTG